MQPLSVMLQGIQAATGVPLTRADSAPDDVVFSDSPDIKAEDLLRQIRLLLTDADWQYQWANKGLGGGHYAYRLWRQPVDPARRGAERARQARSRLAALLADIQGGQSAWDQIAQDDPDTAEALQSPLLNSRIQLLGSLSPGQLDGVLAGAPLTLPVASLTPDQRRLVHIAATGSENGRGTSISIWNGVTRVLFDSNHIDTGQVVFQAQPSALEPGAWTVTLGINTEPGLTDGDGSDVLYNDAGPGPDQVSGQYQSCRQQKQAQALTDAAPGSNTVTIPADEKAAPGEPPLAAYLRDFAQQTRLTVLAFWPQGDPAPQKRLPQSITDAPILQALQTLGIAYQCEWIQDGKVVRIRPRRVVRPAAPAPGAHPPKP